MGDHLIDGEFQSDKYPTTPRGKVPLSCKDITAQDLLWEYAQRRRSVDAEFAADLEFALTRAGYVPAAAIRALEKRATAAEARLQEIAEIAESAPRDPQPVLSKLRRIAAIARSKPAGGEG